MEAGDKRQVEIAHLLSMANDITANLCLHADAEDRVADHINRFWAPRMRKLLLENAAVHADDLPGILVRALQKLKT